MHVQVLVIGLVFPLSQVGHTLAFAPCELAKMIKNKETMKITLIFKRLFKSTNETEIIKRWQKYRKKIQLIVLAQLTHSFKTFQLFLYYLFEFHAYFLTRFFSFDIYRYCHRKFYFIVNSNISVNRTMMKFMTKSCFAVFRINTFVVSHVEDEAFIAEASSRATFSARWTSRTSWKNNFL